MAAIHNSTQFRGVTVPKVFPDPAIVIVGETKIEDKIGDKTEDKTEITVGVVAAPALETTKGTPVDSFSNSKTDVWLLGANTMAANLAALAGLSKFLQIEVQSLNKPVWASNIQALATTLGTAVEQCNKLCNDTNTTLGETNPTTTPSTNPSKE